MKVFEEIAEHALDAAGNVPCSLGKYLDGLQEMADIIAERISLTADELDREDDEIPTRFVK